jgi:phage terminase large subunit
MGAMSVNFDPILDLFWALYKTVGTDHIVLCGGRFSAKSWAVALALVYYACKYKCFILCTRMIQISIGDSSKKLIENTIERLGIGFEFTITDTYIKNNRTGTTFIFKGLQDVRSLEGVDFCWVEEAQYVTEKAGEDLTPTIRKHNATIFWTLNQIYQTDWVCKKFLGDTPAPRTKVIRVNITDLPRHIIPESKWTEYLHDMETREKYARHKWLGEYADAADMRIAPMYVLQEAQRRTQQAIGEHVVGFDVGGGGDASVLTHRQGNCVHYQQEFNENDPQVLGSKVATKIRATVPIGSTVYYDEGGIGWGMGAILKALLPGYRIVGVNFGSSPIGPQSKARNRRAEMYMRAVDAMRGGLSLAGCHPDIIEEFASISCWENASGLLTLEEKKDVKKRIGRSTDKADSLVLTYAGGVKIARILPESQQSYTPAGSWMD